MSRRVASFLGVTISKMDLPMNDIALTALFLVAFLKSDMSCLYGPRLNPEKYLASIAGGDLLGVDREAYPACLSEASTCMLPGAHSEMVWCDLLRFQPRTDSRVRDKTL